MSSTSAPDRRRLGGLSIAFSIAAGHIVVPLWLMVLILEGISLLPPGPRADLAGYDLLLGLPLLALGVLWWLGAVAGALALVFAVIARARVPTVVAATALGLALAFGALRAISAPASGIQL